MQVQGYLERYVLDVISKCNADIEKQINYYIALSSSNTLKAEREYNRFLYWEFVAFILETGLIVALSFFVPMLGIAIVVLSSFIAFSLLKVIKSSKVLKECDNSNLHCIHKMKELELKIFENVRLRDRVMTGETTEIELVDMLSDLLEYNELLVNGDYEKKKTEIINNDSKTKKLPKIPLRSNCFYETPKPKVRTKKK